MPPQRLSKVKPNAGLALGPGTFSMRPQLAALVAAVIAFSAEIELQRGRLLAALLGSPNHETALAMYLSLTSGAARRSALRAAAQTALTGVDLHLFEEITKASRATQKERNDFAHGLWGYSDDLPDSLLLVDSAYRLKDTLRINALFEQLSNGIIPQSVGDIRLDPSQIRVYREADLGRSVQNIERMYHLHYALADLPTLPSDAQLQLRARLSAQLRQLRPPKPSK
jgi:hypothetical protein